MAELEWSPDSKTLVAFRIEPGERKEVYLARVVAAAAAAGPTAHPPLRAARRQVHALRAEPVRRRRRKSRSSPTSSRSTSAARACAGTKDGHTSPIERTDRGHQRFRLIEVDAHTGTVAQPHRRENRDVHLDRPHREPWTSDAVNWLEKTDEIIYASERDGWRHLYLVDAKTGSIKNQITQGEYVVRGIDRIDEEKRQIWFRASGKNPDQDPYFIHYYRVNFDGTGLVALTEGNGTHTDRSTRPTAST